MKVYDTNLEIRVSNHITYIIIADTKSSKMKDKVEDLTYIDVNNLPIDVVYYLDVMKRLLIDIFSLIIDNSRNTEEKMRDNVEKVLRWRIKIGMSEEIMMRLKEEVERELREKVD